MLLPKMAIQIGFCTNLHSTDMARKFLPRVNRQMSGKVTLASKNFSTVLTFECFHMNLIHVFFNNDEWLNTWSHSLQFIAAQPLLW